MMQRRRTSLVRTENIFRLSYHENDDDDDTNETMSVSTSSTRLSFPSAASNNIVSSLGILSWEEQLEAIDDAKPKLDFGNLKVIGRDSEIAQLQAAFDRAATGPSEAVELHGYAGTGKTTLVERALREHVVDRNGFFVMGKFEQLRKNEPYSAIMEAFSDVCDLILDSGEFECVRNAINTSMGNDAEILCRLVGENLSTILQHKAKTVRFQALSMDNAFSRLKLLCRSFIRSVCSAKHPLVLFLDDIQFADKSSLKILKSLLRDTTTCHVLIVFSYREEAMTSELKHMLSIFNKPEEEEKASAILSHDETIRDTTTENHKKEKGKHDTVLPRIKIHVTAMHLDVINQLVATVTSLDLVSTRGLAEIVELKTMGNAFFVIQYLEALQRDGFLYLNKGRWKWDLKDVRNDTAVSDNVATLVAAKVKRQKSNIRLVLKVAACLGSRFCVRLLRDICYEEFVNNTEKATAIERFKKCFAGFLSIAKNEGLIEKCGKTEYKFVSSSDYSSAVYISTDFCYQHLTFQKCHDKVQRCLYNMIPAGASKDAIHLAIGFQIVRKMDMLKKEDNCLIFLAAEHLNRGRAVLAKYEDKVSLIRLNLQASKHAASQAAFSLASEYLNTCDELFNTDTKWETHTDLAIDVYSTLAEIQYCAGHFQTCDRVCQDVIKHSPSQKQCLRVYYTMIESLSTRGKFRAAITLGFNLLRSMGESFPRRGPNMIHVMLEVAKARLIVTEKTDDDLLELPISRDEDVVARMRLLSNVAACAYMTSQHGKTFAMVALRMIQTTIQYGLTGMAPHAFAAYATILVFLGNYDEGFRFGQLTLRLLDRIDAPETEARSLSTVFLLVNHWRRPLREGLPYFERSFQLGRATGDIEYSFYSVVGKTSTMFYLGVPLKEVEAEIRKFACEMIDFKQRTPFRLLAPCWQLILNLMGKCDDPTQLTGEAIELEKTLHRIEEDQHMVAVFVTLLNQLRLGYFFDNWDVVEDVIPMIEGKYKANNNHFSNCASVYDRGLAYYELFRRTNKRTWKHKGHNMLAQLEKWANEGVVSCHGMAKLLKAERLGFKGDLSDCIVAYDRAIQSFAAEGIIQQQAIAQERAAYFLMERSMNEKALDYLLASRESYLKWGAITKVRYMEIKFELLLQEGIGANDPRRPSKTIYATTAESVDGVSTLTTSNFTKF